MPISEISPCSSEISAARPSCFSISIDRNFYYKNNYAVIEIPLLGCLAKWVSLADFHALVLTSTKLIVI